MKHFKTHAPFEEMFSHLKSNTESKIRKKVCILHTAREGIQDIYISTDDETLIELLKEKFEMQECASPAGILKDEGSEWMIRGNSELLEM